MSVGEIGEICNRDVVTVDRKASVYEAARLMRDHHVGSLIVVDPTSANPARPLGIVTDRDLVIEIMAKEAPEEALLTGDLMGPELLTGRETDGVWETILRMRAMGVRRMPVVTAEGSLAGILSMDDLLQFLAGELTDLVRLIRREHKREVDTRPPV
jgi:signal-transduction protein with cAMP-binding, CBS, and nucleotidyltransferase domain